MPRAQQKSGAVRALRASEEIRLPEFFSSGAPPRFLPPSSRVSIPQRYDIFRMNFHARQFSIVCCLPLMPPRRRKARQRPSCPSPRPDSAGTPRRYGALPPLPLRKHSRLRLAFSHASSAAKASPSRPPFETRTGQDYGPLRARIENSAQPRRSFCLPANACPPRCAQRGGEAEDGRRTGSVQAWQAQRAPA